MAEAAIKPFGLPGHQRVIWTWSDQNQIRFGQSSLAIIDAIRQGTLANLARSSNDWSVTYGFDQFVYTLPGKPEQGFGLFGYYGVGPGVVNPIRACYSLGVGGKGMIPTRAKDTYGVGYYLVNLSDRLSQVIKDRSNDEQGVELYYNIEVTPWLHVTPDLQIIDPGRQQRRYRLGPGLAGEDGPVALGRGLLTGHRRNRWRGAVRNPVGIASRETES